MLVVSGINGGRNIVWILLTFIESNGNINSRPLALSRDANRIALADVNDDEKEQDTPTWS